MEIRIGTFGKSLAGHDKNQVYVIINCDDEYVYLVDGKNKLLANPKKKRIKHIQPVHVIDPVVSEKINNNLLNNEDIKKAIKNYQAGQ